MKDRFTKGYTVKRLHRSWEKMFVVNKDYQRSDNVWSLRQKSYLIETLLLNYPMPMAMIVDKGTLFEIIDGQQRCSIIIEFINNGFKLTNISEKYKGKYFKDLDDQDKENFLEYYINVDVIKGYTEAEIVDIFIRMNKKSYPLNNQEIRNALNFGPYTENISIISDYFISRDPISNLYGSGGINRYKHYEFITELMLLHDNIGLEFPNINKIGVDNMAKKANQNDGAFNFNQFGETLMKFCDTLENTCKKDDWNDKVLVPYIIRIIYWMIVNNKIKNNGNIEDKINSIDVEKVNEGKVHSKGTTHIKKTILLLEGHFND